MQALQINPFVGNGKIIAIKTDDGEVIECTFHDRGSNKLVIVGAGYGNEREKVAPLVHIFNSYDIITFDYPYQGKNKPKVIDITTLQTNSSAIISLDRIPNIDTKKATFGQHEEEYVKAVLTHMKTQKHYDSVYGVGFCLSSFVLAKTALLNPGLMDKLILDSCMYSPRETIDRITQTPQLLFDPQRGSWDSLIKIQDPKTNICIYIEQSSVVQAVKTFLEKILPKDTKTETLGDYLSKLKIPVLFFHGKQDMMTPYEIDFKKSWQAASSQEKAAVIFDDTKHLINHIKHKELYKGISTLFLELPYEQFISTLKNKEKFVEYRMNQSISELNSIINKGL
jgi:pimeloyl-ACP methyl ester carboxylesterase